MGKATEQKRRISDVSHYLSELEVRNLDEVNAIWTWVSSLRAIRKGTGNKKAQLLTMCKESAFKFDTYIDFRFPSKIVENIAHEFENAVIAEGTRDADDVSDTNSTELLHEDNIKEERLKFPFHNKATFQLVEIMEYFSRHKETISPENADGLLVVLIDTALYKAYEMLSDISSGRFIFQLNACIILDAMIIKPDIASRGELNDLSPLLRAVTEKADSRMDALDLEVVWAIAMLSYKTQRYRRARRYFTRFIALIDANISNDSRNSERYMYAKIAIGYCFEKWNDSGKTEQEKDHFTRAIDHFEGLLDILQNNKPLSPNNEVSIDQKKVGDYIVELHHGLGHFYNERAIFGNAPNPPAHDILTARQHMRYALKHNPSEFASCYGALFYEYRDYGAALDIFNEFSNEEKPRDNEESNQELQFYIAQSETLYPREGHGNPVEKLKNFEDYCRSTFNYDGIIHARIFSTMAYLRLLPFTDSSPHRESRRKKIADLYNSLTEFTLSNYAAISIRNEYEKAKFMLRVYRSLYWDDQFVWRSEDVQYNLKKLIPLMPEKARSINCNDVKEASGQTNLYIITINGLDIWCVAGYPFPDTLLETKGGSVSKYIPVYDTAAVYHQMEFSDHTNYIVVLPPAGLGEESKEIPTHPAIESSSAPDPERSVARDMAAHFKSEISSIKDLHCNLCFVIPKRDAYDREAISSILNKGTQNITFMHVETDTEAVQYAFCFRAFFIMRHELLQPMPLFTLVPTHLILAYNYQEGQSLNLLIDEMRNQSYLKSPGANPNPLYWRLGEAYKQQEPSVNQNIFNAERRSLLTASLFANESSDENTQASALKQYEGMPPCIKKAALTVCCPQPVQAAADTYISYRISSPEMFKRLVFSQIVSGEIDSGKIYRMKAMQDYPSIYFTLRNALEQCHSCSESCETYGLDECSLYCSGQESPDGIRDIIESNSFELLKSILGRKWDRDSQSEFTMSDLNQKYRCVLRRTIENSGQAIYIMLLNNSSNSHESDERVAQPKTDFGGGRKKKVCLSYAWTNEKAHEEVNQFAQELQRRLGSDYDVDYDLKYGPPDESWLHKTMELFKSGDKFIVLLSKEYKRKADNEQDSGVRLEADILKSYIANRPHDILFASLPSQKGIHRDELMPLVFTNAKNINDLSRNEPFKGHGLDALIKKIRSSS